METFDYSKGSFNKYTVEAKHGLIRKCIGCGLFDPITLDGFSYYRYFVHGHLIQEAFPNLSAYEREHILTGVHPACQDSMFDAPVDDALAQFLDLDDDMKDGAL